MKRYHHFNSWMQEKTHRHDFRLFSRKCSVPSCRNQGWGPMLRLHVWNRIVKPGEIFLCEPCMVKRLGTAINQYHLRDCAMNQSHPAYRPSEYADWIRNERKQYIRYGSY